tara:strand:+ start:2263 stop:3117 length:855 start_codon:yes stop_codon:yes gene_type:complete
MSFKTTLIPEYTDTIILQKEEFYKKNTDLIDVIGDYLTELNLNIDYEKGKSSGRAFANTVLFYKSLNDEDFTIDDKKIDESFKNYYIEKYNSLFIDIKNSVSNFIKDNVYFKNYSDDVGILFDSNSIIDNSISPYFDVFYSETEIPNNLNTTIFNKTTLDNKSLQKKFTKFNDALMKTNLKGIVGDNSDITVQTTSHGYNITNDYKYYERFFDFKEPMIKNIVSNIKGLGEYILFIKDLNLRDNETESSLFSYSYKIEGIEEQYDILKNKLDVSIYTSNSILSS